MAYCSREVIFDLIVEMQLFVIVINYLPRNICEEKTKIFPSSSFSYFHFYCCATCNNQDVQ